MEYEFEAPTYCNFGEEMEDDESDVSRYFDVDHDEPLSVSVSKSTPGVKLPEGPRDLMSAKKENDSIGRQESKRPSNTPRKRPGRKQTPARLKTPLKSKTVGRVKKLSRSSTPHVTPGKVAAAFTALKLTPAKIVTASIASPASVKRGRSSLTVTSSASKRARALPENGAAESISNLVVSPIALNVDELVNDAVKSLMGSSRKGKPDLSGRRISIVDGIEISLPNEKEHAMETRADKATREPPIQLRSRSVSRIMSGKNPVSTSEVPSRSSSQNRSQSSERQPVQPSQPRVRSQSSDRMASSTKFSTVNKASVAPFVSLAEATKRFQNRTPQRFRLKARNSPGLKAKGPLLALRPTIPQSPALRVKHRSRPTTALSREEQEAKELEEIRKHKFKPLPLPEKILKPLNPVLNIEKKPPTLPEPFKITEVKKRDLSHEPGPEPVKFIARPVPKKILEGPVGIAAKRLLPLTDPKSPSFRASALRRSRDNARRITPSKQNKVTVKTMEEDNGVSTVKVKELAHFGVPFKPQESRGSTGIKPFSFEERDKNWLQRKEEKIKELQEQLVKKPIFHANPLPSFKTPPRRARSQSPGIRRRTPSTQELNIGQKVGPKVPETKPALLPQFKARPPAVLHRKPFEPVKPHRQLPLPDVTLASEKRAKERELFDQQLMQREMELETLRKKFKAEQERQEREEIAKLRKQVVHKPHPVPHVKPFEPQPSNKPLTDPTTPHCLKRSSRQMAA